MKESDFLSLHGVPYGTELRNGCRLAIEAMEATMVRTGKPPAQLDTVVAFLESMLAYIDKELVVSNFGAGIIVVSGEREFTLDSKDHPKFDKVDNVADGSTPYTVKAGNKSQAQGASPATLRAKDDEAVLKAISSLADLVRGIDSRLKDVEKVHTQQLVTEDQLTEEDSEGTLEASEEVLGTLEDDTKEEAEVDSESARKEELEALSYKEVQAVASLRNVTAGGITKDAMIGLILEEEFKEDSEED